MNTAVIYARFSSSKQREASITDQLRVCRGWCERNNYRVVAEYCDRAASGRTDDRPEFQRMISNAGESDIVLVYMMDRFSRDVYHAPLYKHKLKEKGVKVVSAMEAMPEGPESIIIESIYEAIAAMESAHTSQRTIRGMDGNAMKLMHNGVDLYGYDLGDDGFYHVNQDEALFVRKAFGMRAEGMSYGLIADALARDGVLTRRGNPCTYGMIQNMIRNERYRGVYKWKEIRKEGGMPRIVTDEEFFRANSVKSSKRRDSEQWRDFPLRGVCLNCGHNLVGVSGRGRKNVKYSYYRCSQKCGLKPVRADWAEAEIAKRLRLLLDDDDLAYAMADAISDALTDGDDHAKRAMAEKRHRNACSAIANITKAIEEGMPYSMMKDRMDDLIRERDEAQALLNQMDNEVMFDRDEFVEFLRTAKGLSDLNLLKAFVWQLQMSDEKLVAVLNYSVKGEPARVEVSTGSHESIWLPRPPTSRTKILLQRGGTSLGIFGDRICIAVDRNI